MKKIYVLALLLITTPLMAMNIGSGLYRFEFEVSLIIFVATMLTIGHFPEIKGWIMNHYHQYFTNKNQAQEP